MKVRLDQFVEDPTTNLLVHPYYTGFEYSDGLEVENRIYQILLNAKDRSLFSAELQNAIADWPTEYHFSPLRHNLLRHFHFKETDKILELGCGCGAITRQLGESGATVVAIEGSRNRAKCAAARCMDLTNVGVYAGNFQDIALERTYDYVTMIGVFEYSPTYFFEDNPESACLEIARSALKPGGKLILAIENRLGLKYFMGLKEDHTGIPFSGIQDLYARKSVKTYGRVELKVLLERNGFCSIEFQYPFPDYKIPNVVLTEKAFDSTGFRPAEIVRQFASRDYSVSHKPLFSETLVWPVLERNHLIPDLANSFLVIARTEPHILPEDNLLLAVKYTLNRISKYNTRTEFILKELEGIVVKKSSLRDEPDVAVAGLIHCLSDEIYHEGVNLDGEIDRMILRDDFEGYLSCIRQWIGFIKNNGIKTINEADIYDSLALPEFIDCIPANLIITDSGISLIDREWKFMKDFTLTTLLLRYLIYEKNISFINRHLKGSEPAVAKILKHLSIRFDKKIYEDFQNIEHFIFSEVYPYKDAGMAYSGAPEKGHKNTAVMIRDIVFKLLRYFYRKIVDRN